METELSFAELMERVRTGDDRAATQMFEQYEGHVRRFVRVRLHGALQRELDTTDVCQSVMANFFVRAALGQFEVETPEQLIKLLATMARNRLLKHVERQQAQRRDVRRVQSLGEGEPQVPSADRSPSSLVANRELLDNVRRLLTVEERELAEDRAAGRGWAELAAERNVSADALRVRHARAMDRVALDLGLDEAPG